MMTLKEIVQERLRQLDIGPIEAATHAALERTFIRDIVEDKKKSIRSDKMEQLAYALGLDAAALTAGKLVPVGPELSSPLVARKQSSLVTSYDPDAPIADTTADNGFNGEYWKPSIPGALPEVDAEAGAGLGAIGEVVNVQVGNTAISAHKVVAEWVLPDQFLLHQAGASKRQSIVMEVRGDSMQPGFLPGDRVIVDLAQREFSVDGVYVFSDGHGEPQIKRLQKVMFSDPVAVRIISDNPIYGASDVELSRVHIIGRVRGHVGRM